MTSSPSRAACRCLRETVLSVSTRSQAGEDPNVTDFSRRLTDSPRSGPLITMKTPPARWRVNAGGSSSKLVTLVSRLGGSSAIRFPLNLARKSLLGQSLKCQVQAGGGAFFDLYLGLRLGGDARMDDLQVVLAGSQRDLPVVGHTADLAAVQIDPGHPVGPDRKPADFTAGLRAQQRIQTIAIAAAQIDDRRPGHETLVRDLE